LLLLVALPLTAQQLPIVFVHGNGDSSSLWITTVWRFESNGYDRSRLFALDFPHPSALSDDTKPAENRTSSADEASYLAKEVARVLQVTGQKKVVLIGSSRGGNTIRNYIKNFGGSSTVAKAILGGTPNHGVLKSPDVPNNEFNGLGTFLTGLNTGSEVTPGVEFMTIRSDTNDKYAEPHGGGYEWPELKGAKNVVIPGIDHRETAFHNLAFKAMYEFITGKPPATLDYVAEAKSVLNGMVGGFAAGAYTNVPAAGVTVNVYETDPATGQRRGAVVHTKTTGADGMWGPFTAKPDAYYEFVFNGIHIYRTPFPRSSSYVGLRIRPAEQAEGSIVYLTRPRGYLGHGRDTFLVDGKVPDGVVEGVPTSDSARVKFPAGAQRAVPVMLNGEKITVLTWPASEGQIAVAEFH
jgi:hypothetical protein